MIHTGTNIIEIKRIRKSRKNPKFLSRLFSPEELKFLTKVSFHSYYIAENFAAKEALVKSLSSGFNGFTFADISVLRDAVGHPYISLNGNAKKIAQRDNLKFSVSISHCKEYATAVVVAYN